MRGVVEIAIQHEASAVWSIKTIPSTIIALIILCVGKSIRTASALSVIQHGLRGGMRYTAWHVIFLAFLTQETRPVRC